MTDTLTIYGNKVRVIVQTKGLSPKAASEVAAHFEKTIAQTILDAPHVGTMREHQITERGSDAPEPAAPEAAPETPKKAAKKAKKTTKKTRGFFRP